MNYLPKTVYFPSGPYILPRTYILLSYHEIIGRSNVGEACWWKMYVGEKPVCWWNLKLFQEHTFHQHTEKVSPTYFTNIHLNLCSKCSPTYRKFFTNILHQHTFNFLFKFFTNIQFFSPTYRKLFANILHQYTYKFLSSPTYSFTNIQKILHQHTFFHQHISPTYFTNITTVAIHSSHR